MIHTLVEKPPEPVTEKITYEEFLKKYHDVHAEWVDGEVILLRTASTKHQKLVLWLANILSLFIEKYELGLLLTAPFNMYMPSVGRGRESDILFVSRERLDIVQASNLSEAADLVIEIVSPESVERDRGSKFVEYEAAGVREYWLIDPDRQQAEFYRLTGAGRYNLVFPGDNGVFHSEVLSNFWLRIDWLWQEPMPRVLTIVRELGLLDQ